MGSDLITSIEAPFLKIETRPEISSNSFLDSKDEEASETTNHGETHSASTNILENGIVKTMVSDDVTDASSLMYVGNHSRKSAIDSKPVKAIKNKTLLEKYEDGSESQKNLVTGPEEQKGQRKGRWIRRRVKISKSV